MTDANRVLDSLVKAQTGLGSRCGPSDSDSVTDSDSDSAAHSDSAADSGSDTDSENGTRRLTNCDFDVDGKIMGVNKLAGVVAFSNSCAIYKRI